MEGGGEEGGGGEGGGAVEDLDTSDVAVSVQQLDQQLQHLREQLDQAHNADMEKLKKQHEVINPVFCFIINVSLSKTIHPTL